MEHISLESKYTGWLRGVVSIGLLSSKIVSSTPKVIKYVNNMYRGY